MLFFNPQGQTRLAFLQPASAAKWQYYVIQGDHATPASPDFVTQTIEQSGSPTESFMGPSPLLEDWLRNH
jgi:hypothetical protein